jgi:hypothetical protein
MTSTPSITLVISLDKRSMAQLIVEAERVGLPPEDYAKRLVENGLAAMRQAASMTLAEIMKPVRRAAEAVSESEIMELVDRARSDHHRRLTRGKKR